MINKKVKRPTEYTSESYWFYVDIIIILFQFFVMPFVFAGLKKVYSGQSDILLGALFLTVFLLEFFGWLIISHLPLPPGSRSGLTLFDMTIWMCHIACDMVLVFWGLQALGIPITSDPGSASTPILFAAFALVVAKSLFWLFRLIDLDRIAAVEKPSSAGMSILTRRIGADISMSLYSLISFTGIWSILSLGKAQIEVVPVLEILYAVSSGIFFMIAFAGSRAWNLIIQLRQFSPQRVFLPFFYMPVINSVVGILKLFNR